MAAPAPSTIVKQLPMMPVVYRRSSDRFDFLTTETPAWCVSQFGIQYRVVASEPFVSTGDLCEPAGDAIHMETAMAELRAVVNEIREVRPLPPAPSLDDLLARAVQLRGTPANIEEWARQLASDVGELVD